MVKHSESNNKGFTLLEMLVVVAIIAILIALAYGLFKDQIIKAKVATDASNVRNAKALAITEHLEHKKNAVYVYDANQGSILIKDEDDISGVEGYGQTPYSYSKSLATGQIQEDTYGAIGHPISKNGTKNFVCVRIAKGDPVKCYWRSADSCDVSVPKDDDHGGGGVVPPEPPKPDSKPKPGTWEHFNKYYVVHLKDGESYDLKAEQVVQCDTGYYRLTHPKSFKYKGEWDESPWNLNNTEKCCYYRKGHVYTKDNFIYWGEWYLPDSRHGDVYWDGFGYKVLTVGNMAKSLIDRLPYVPYV